MVGASISNSMRIVKRADLPFCLKMGTGDGSVAFYGCGDDVCAHISAVVMTFAGSGKWLAQIDGEMP